MDKGQSANERVTLAETFFDPDVIAQIQAESKGEVFNVCSPGHSQHMNDDAGYCCGSNVCRHECCRDTFYDRLPADHFLITGKRVK